MATKVTSKKAKSVNNRPNCLKVTKRMQKVNLQTVTTADGKKIKTSGREARSMKKDNKKRMKLRFIAISLWEMFFLCQFVIMLL